jgi:hypothetical protein
MNFYHNCPVTKKLEIEITRDTTGYWSLSAIQCWVLSGIIYCPYCGKKLEETK